MIVETDFSIFTVCGNCGVFLWSSDIICCDNQKKMLLKNYVEEVLKEPFVNSDWSGVMDDEPMPEIYVGSYKTPVNKVLQL